MIGVVAVLGLLVIAVIVLFGGIASAKERAERAERAADRALGAIGECVSRYHYQLAQDRMDNLSAKSSDTRQRIDALAKALGYEWKPEGKTPARWEQVDQFSRLLCSYRFGVDEAYQQPKPVHARRKGDKKRGGK